MARAAILMLAASLAVSSAALAQENGPVVLSPQIQQLATKFPIAQRLGIKWGSASTNDIGRYMGFLAAANEIADAIAVKNNRKEPSNADYMAAFASLCIWPPNKPPIAESSWKSAFAAFDNQKVRDALRAGVGPLATSLPKEITAGKGAEAVMMNWPKKKKAYWSGVLNLGNLPNAK